MKKNVTKKIFYSAAATAVFAGSAVSGVNAIANADDDIKQFDKDSIVVGEHVNDAEAYPYSADPYPSSSEYPSSTSPAPSKPPAPENPPILTDNVHNSGAGGMVNCNGGDVCVEKVGDEVQVSYEIQFSNIVNSSNRVQTVTGSLIAFPSVIKNPKLEVVSTSIEGESLDYPKHVNGFPTHTFQQPVEVPLFEEGELKKSDFTPMEANVGFTLKDENNPESDDSYVSKFDNDDSRFATHIKGEEIVSQFKDGYEKFKQEKPGRTVDGNGKIITTDAWNDVTSFSGLMGDQALPEYGAMEVDYPYDYLLFNNDSRGVTTYRLTGIVETESDLAYLPIRAKQGMWKCSQEGALGGYDHGCQSLAEYEWGRNRDVLPRYSLENDDVTRNNLKNDTKDGLHGSLKCAVTEDLGRYDLIGADVRPRDLGGSSSWGAKYNETFRLHGNPAVSYLVGSYGVAEDGCDQAGIKISICEEDEQPTSPVTPPSSETTTTPPRDDRPGSSTEPVPSSEVTSSEPPMPSDEPTPSKEPTPETTPRDTPTIPEPEPRETPEVPEDTPSTTKPAARIIPSSPAPVVNPPAVNHTLPAKQPVPNNPSRVNTPPFVPAPAPVQPAAIPGPVSEHGPVVNTGGAVQESFWTKIANIFR